MGKQIFFSNTLFHRLQHLFQHLVSMADRDEVALKLRRADVNAVREHIAEVTGKTLLVASLGVLEIADGRVVEKQREHRAATVELYALAVDDLAEASDETVAAAFEVGVESGVVEKVESSDARRHCHGVAAERTRLIHRAVGGEALHNVSPAAKSRRREAAANNLANRCHIGRDAKTLLCAAVCKAEARYHLVENQHCAVLGGDFACRLQEILVGHHDAHIAGDGFQYECRHSVAVGIKILPQRLYVVVRKHYGILDEIRRNARRRRIADIGDARARRHQEMVGVSVVIALKLHQNVPFRVASRHADCRHRCLCAAVDKPQPFHRRKRAAHLLGERRLCLGGYAVTTAAQHRADGGVGDRRIVVSEDENAPRHTEIDELIAVNISDIRAFGVIDENRGRAHASERTDGAVDAAGNHLASPLVSRL